MRVHYLKIFALTSAVLAAFLVGACVSRAVDALLGFSGYRSTASMVTGAPLLLLGTGLRVWASHTFYANRLGVVRLQPQSRILTSGPYAYSRNPLYLGLLSVAIGWVLYLGATFGLLYALVFFAFVRFWVRKEETELEREFGEEYARYRASVPRWGWGSRTL